MARVVGIGFKEVGKLYYFSPTINLDEGDFVVVETARGLEVGQVIVPIKDIDDSLITQELKEVVRLATKEDLKRLDENKERAEKALKLTKEIVEDHNLDMKLLDCEYTLDREKIIIYYNADGRVDFRNLLKDLANELRVRIELRQIGPREGAKFVGGIGSCGREICCAKHLREFELVTMKMAKDQGMTLNSSKVAGLCGKLMCCIGYENSLYEELKKETPLVGDFVKTPSCENCKVIGIDLLSGVVKTYNDKTSEVEVWTKQEVVNKSKKKEIIDPKDLTDDVIEDDLSS